MYRKPRSVVGGDQLRGLPLAHFLGSNEIECARKIRCTEKVDCTAEVPEVDPCERLPSPAKDGANPHACRACHGEKCTSVRCEYDTETGNDRANASRCSMGLGLPIAAETSQEVFAGLFRTFVVAACGGIEANGRCGYKGIDALASIHSFYQPPDNSDPAFVKQVFVFVAPSVVDGCASDVDNRVAGCECFDEFFSSSCRQEFAADGDNCVPFPAQMGGQMGPDETRGAAEGDRFFLVFHGGSHCRCASPALEGGGARRLSQMHVSFRIVGCRGSHTTPFTAKVSLGIDTISLSYKLKQCFDVLLLCDFEVGVEARFEIGPLQKVETCFYFFGSDLL